MNAYLVYKMIEGQRRGQRSELVGVFDSESGAASYLRSKGDYEDSHEIAKDLRECYVRDIAGNELVFRMKTMPMNKGA